MLVHARHILVMLACLFALLGAPAAAQAQTAADTAGVLLGVATRLQAEGQTQLSRAIIDLILQRYRGTAAALEAARMRDQLQAGITEQSGRTELMVFGTTYGLWLGAAIPAALGADDPAPYGVGLILGGPSGFLASRAYARNRSLTVGQARAITFGGTWGTWQGLGWLEARDNSPTTKALMTAMIAGGGAGILVGAALSNRNIPSGTATTVSFGGLWGSWFGGAIAASTDADGDAVLTSTLLAGNAGILVTALGAPKWKFSRPRARLVSISGVAGMLTGFGLLLIMQPDNDSAILWPVATSAAGLALGVHWTRNYQETGSRGDGSETRRWGNLEGPTLQPTVLERVRNGRLERVPALGVRVFQATF